MLRRAARTLRSGGIVAYPTEAVFGLGCDPLNPDAADRLMQLKGRAASKGFILVGSDYHQLSPFVAEPDADRMRRIVETWPGPHTWVFDAAADTPWWLTGGRTSIAIRVTSHPATAALCDAFGGAIVSTSANRAGQKPARSPLAVRRLLAGGVDAILHDSLGGLDRPTIIQDARTGTLLRT